MDRSSTGLGFLLILARYALCIRFLREVCACSRRMRWPSAGRVH